MSQLSSIVDRPGRTNALVGAAVFAVTLGVYALCTTPTVPYWDSGEFIATSHILGIPHPPGTPLYVLIGRLFSLLPLGSIAVRVNLLSGLCSALAVLFTYLITVRLARLNSPREMPEWLAYAGGVVAAFFMAWSPTFWENGIEAEVYSAASAIMCLCVWLGLLWWERQGQPRNDRFLWVILYILFLAIGIHLGAFLVFPCLYLLVTMVHWERVRKSGFWWSIIVFLAAAAIRFAIIASINDQDPRITELSIAPESTRRMADFLALIMAGALCWNLVAVLGLRFFAGIAVLAFLGVSVHLYLLLRARLNPGINEADPSTWDALKLVLIRDQYKPPEPIFRKAPILYQFDYMYLRYFFEQFKLFGPSRWPTEVPVILLGLFGAWNNYFRERKSFWFMVALFMITGPFLVWYLNFKVGEVRERDYFFVMNFHFFAIWIGMGATALLAGLAARLGKAPAGRRPAPAMVTVAALLVVGANLPLVAGGDNQNFHQHDRRGNWVAHGYGRNMLVGLDPGGILFTNGDNDTFPLWYMQEVEDFRKDVRVINLSLLQTPWYIQQLKDEGVPISMSPQEIQGLEPFRDRTGKIWMVNDIMVNHIVETNQWKRPIYFAVTVPDLHGYDAQLRMEGLVFRLYKDKVKTTFDVDRLDENLNHKFDYRGFLTPSGDWDDRVYKDDEATKLLQNYMAARVRLAIGLNDLGRRSEALAELDRVRKVAGHFPGVDVALGITYQELGLTDRAIEYFQDVLRKDPENSEFLGGLGHVLLVKGDTARAIEVLNHAIKADPAGDFNPYAELINVHRERNELQPTLDLLQSWLRQHPDDQRIRAYYDALTGAPVREKPGTGTEGGQ